MVYLNRDQAKRLQNVSYRVSAMIEVAQFSDVSNRTLTVSCTNDLKTVFHVYLKDNSICTHFYNLSNEAVETVDFQSSDKAYAYQLLPKKAVYPRVTDLEFALLMMINGSPLRFRDFDDMLSTEEYSKYKAKIYEGF